VGAGAHRRYLRYDEFPACVIIVGMAALLKPRVHEMQFSTTTLTPAPAIE
jgi:hypothetical protein